jgi:hypothetical protein
MISNSTAPDISWAERWQWAAGSGVRQQGNEAGHRAHKWGAVASKQIIAAAAAADSPSRGGLAPVAFCMHNESLTYLAGSYGSEGSEAFITHAGATAQ